MTQASLDLTHCGRGGVVVTSSGSPANRLGIIRGFGRRNIPVIYLDFEQSSIVKYSKYITVRLKSPNPADSETEYINALLDFGRLTKDRMIIIPASDREVLILAKYKQKLEKFYGLPVSPFETTQKLVNKKEFYKWLIHEKISHPKTYFPKSIDDLQVIAHTVPYPYVIKPVYSHIFQEKFGQKCFIVNTARDLDQAVRRLQTTPGLEVVIQEVVPGKEMHSLYMYLDVKSRLLGVSGYDKIRHWPVDFGFGSFCTSKWRPDLAKLCVELLQTTGYYGFAEAEFIRDQRDQQYKLIEINPRTTLQNRLPASCGADIEFIAYLDSMGKQTTRLVRCREDAFWVNDFVDVLSVLIQVRRKQTRISDLSSSLNPNIIHSLASVDDPLPFIIYSIQSLLRGAKQIGRMACTGG
jgi:D-aspartate ligase